MLKRKSQNHNDDIDNNDTLYVEKLQQAQLVQGNNEKNKTQSITIHNGNRAITAIHVITHCPQQNRSNHREKMNLI